MLALLFRERWPVQRSRSTDHRQQRLAHATSSLRERQALGALDTAVNFGGPNQAGIAYFVLKPQVTSGNVSATVALQGITGLVNNNLTYPAVGVTGSGRGVIAFTVLGADNFPSAGYASLDAKVGVGDIHVVSAGLGPDDGFTAYKAEVSNPPRTRWGDYGATAVDGSSIWIASEYIGQTCTLAQYRSAPFGSCGGTRTSLGNWDTRISKLTP